MRIIDEIDEIQQTMRFDEFERIDGYVYKITYESSGVSKATPETISIDTHEAEHDMTQKAKYGTYILGVLDLSPGHQLKMTLPIDQNDVSDSSNTSDVTEVTIFPVDYSEFKPILRAVQEES